MSAPKQKVIRKKVIHKFLKAFKAEEAWAEEYACSDDSALAEYVGSLGYGDGPLNFEYVDDDIKEAIDLLYKHDKKSLIDCCAVSLEDLHYVENGIFSATIGEQEHQFSDEMGELYDSLNEAEKAFLRSEHYIKSNFFYTSHDYERFVLVADPEKVSKAAKKLRKKKPELPKKPVVYGPLKLVWSQAEVLND
jgi:hypothetical protein